MSQNCRKSKLLRIVVITVVLTTGVAWGQDRVRPLSFVLPAQSDSDISRTLNSLTKIQGTGVFTQDGLYLITQFGDREEIFRAENRRMIETPLLEQTWRHCSVFSVKTDSSVLVGRNWDNQTVGSIIVNLCYPPDGYSSISFCRSIDIGFGHKGLEPYKDSPFKDRLLLAPFYATDGINEHGLTVACAGVNAVEVRPLDGKEMVYTTFLIRKILEQAKTVDEAVRLVESYVPFDIDQNTVSAHFIVTDSSGRSVILEYVEDMWRAIYPDKTWQALSTKPVYGIPDPTLRERCWRYKGMSEALDRAAGHLSREAGMSILKDVSQEGTAWSVVYSATARELYFSVYQDWDVIYYLTWPESRVSP